MPKSASSTNSQDTDKSRNSKKTAHEKTFEARRSHKKTPKSLKSPQRSSEDDSARGLKMASIISYPDEEEESHSQKKSSSVKRSYRGRVDESDDEDEPKQFSAARKRKIVHQPQRGRNEGGTKKSKKSSVERLVRKGGTNKNELEETEDKVYNPESKRFVSKYGRIGKQILSSNMSKKKRPTVRSPSYNTSDASSPSSGSSGSSFDETEYSDSESVSDDNKSEASDSDSSKSSYHKSEKKTKKKKMACGLGQKKKNVSVKEIAIQGKIIPITNGGTQMFGHP